MSISVLLMRILILCVVCVSIIFTVCPNNCSGHGKCEKSVCECFNDKESGENYGGADCSEHLCFVGNPFGAVHSKNPSESGVISYSSGVNRELFDNTENERELLEEEVSYGIKLLEKLDVDGKLWKVSGLSVLMDELPLSGGILSCKYYKKSDGKDIIDEDAPTTLDVQSYGDGYEYVLFSGNVDKIGGIPSGDGVDTYSKVECNKVLSVRFDLSQSNPIVYSTTRRSLSSNNTTRQLEDPVEITWKGYGPILKDMGLLEVDKEGKKYINEDFKLACYPTTGSISTTTEVTEYDTVTAEYSPGSDGKPNYDVSLTVTSNPAITKGSICLCLMNVDGKIGIEDSEAFDNMRKESGVYKIGKHSSTSTSITQNEEGYDVVVAQTITSGSEIAYTAPTGYDADKKFYFDLNRELYATVLKDGIFTEHVVKITAIDTSKFTIGNIPSGDIMPYLRTFPISELIPTPNTVIKPLNSDKSPYYYKAYYFAEDLLYSLKDTESGKLRCKYNNNAKDIEIDVIGIARNDKMIYFSYFESDKNDLESAKLDCYEILSIRKDLTLLNPSTFTVTARRQRQLSVTDISWDKYGILFNDFGFSSSNPASFACFNMMSSNKEITEYTADVVVADDIMTFTISSPTPSVVGTYLCFLLNTFTSSTQLGLKGLAESEIGHRIQVDNSKYYYGEFAVGTTTTLGKRKSDGSEVIVLSSGSTISLSANTITITDYGSLTDVKKVIDSKLTVGNKFYLKMINTVAEFDEMFVEFTVKELTANQDNTATITIETTETITNYSPYYVIYLSNEKPTEPPTTQPPKPTTITLIDKVNHLYRIYNYLSDNLLNKFSILGGKLQCKKDDGKLEIVDVKGVIKYGNEIIGGFYQFEKDDSEVEINKIVSCIITSSRKDMTLYYPMKYEKDNYMKGYGTILSEIGYKYGKKKMACYNPDTTKVGINNRIISFYEITLSNVKQSSSSIYDLKITFNNEKPDDGYICYLLSDVNGNEISIENSELWKLVRKEDEKYYFGKTKVNDISGKSEEIKKSDGSVSITLRSKDAVAINDADDTGEKMNIFNIDNSESPFFEIPYSFIGIEIQKMLQPGTTITFTFTLAGDITSHSSQILKVENNIDKKRFKIFLSESIYLPSKSRRLRSLDTFSIDPNLMVNLDWTTEGSTHIALECSGQGVCDRSSGICKCYSGFSGSGCQRLDCPNNCNGNGRCVSLSELLSNEDLEKYVGFGNKHKGTYNDNSAGVDVEKNVYFDDQVYGCLCDKRHRGYDCSLIECPSDKDPEGGSNIVGSEYRDCSGRGICNYSTGICECFDGFSGEGCQTMVEMM